MSYRTENETVQELRETTNFYSQRRILFLESGKNFSEEKIESLLNKTDKQLAKQIKNYRESAKKGRIKETPFLYCKY